jgi:hypothetical protein
MFFWNIKELKQQLRNNSISELDSLKYILFLSLIGMVPIPKPPYFTTGTFSITFLEQSYLCSALYIAIGGMAVHRIRIF